jgi:hypothetical protein
VVGKLYDRWNWQKEVHNLEMLQMYIYVVEQRIYELQEMISHSCVPGRVIRPDVILRGQHRAANTTDMRWR